MSQTNGSNESNERSNEQNWKQELITLLTSELPTGWSVTDQGSTLKLTAVVDQEIYERTISLEGLAHLFHQIKNENQGNNSGQDHENNVVLQEKLSMFAKHVAATVRGITQKRELTGHEQHIYPVIRHRSFFDHPQAGSLVIRPHTAETKIAYALDLGEGYALIDQSMLEQATMSDEQLHEYALSNLEKLPYAIKEDQVGPHMLTFVNAEDGYAASRVLLTSFLSSFAEKIEGKELGVAIPHQDVCLLADIHDERGAQLLAQVTLHFVSKGNVPICPLPFIYKENELEPYLVISPTKDK
ncbi:DUF1444 family protein [Brevibacillus daliensis]|uniref:DUF1444 family protein n=1 Tax=Brevibacillus daliensis TaxID=2892995 RepID=UPI001E37DCF4|nr:DUF1444 family protein [Brevibacillus daliensis]